MAHVYARLLHENGWRHEFDCEGKSTHWLNDFSDAMAMYDKWTTA